MSYVDSLTGLFNRHYMREQLVNEADKENPGTLAMIDIDDFKQINDIYGHNAGDYVLKEIANIMKKHCKVSVTIGVAEKDGETIDRWIQEADKRLYVGKNSGKNVVICN